MLSSAESNALSLEKAVNASDLQKFFWEIRWGRFGRSDPKSQETRRECQRRSPDKRHGHSQARGWLARFFPDLMQVPSRMARENGRSGKVATRVGRGRRRQIAPNPTHG